MTHAQARPQETFNYWYIRDQHWARAALPTAFFMLLIAPLLPPSIGVAPVLMYLHLPVYMLHQYEEHGHGAFKHYVNDMLPASIPPAGDGTIFVINVPGVWGVELAALCAAVRGRGASGLVSPYLTLLNGIIHIVAAARQRRYNPGLLTGTVLFVPFGLYTVARASRAFGATPRHHARGIGGAVLLHLFTIVLIVRPWHLLRR